MYQAERICVSSVLRASTAVASSLRLDYSVPLNSPHNYLRPTLLFNG